MSRPVLPLPATPGACRPPDAPAPRAAAAQLLAGAPDAVLGRLVAGDPLGIGALVAARLATLALLLDVERARLRAQALAALHAPSRGEAPLSPWLAARVDEALAQLLAEDAASPDARGLAAFAAPLGLDPAELAAACARFNRLPRELRAAFFDVVLDAKGLERASRTRALPVAELARRARVALELFRPCARAESPAPSRACG